MPLGRGIAAKISPHVRKLPIMYKMNFAVYLTQPVEELQEKFKRRHAHNTLTHRLRHPFAKLMDCVDAHMRSHVPTFIHQSHRGKPLKERQRCREMRPLDSIRSDRKLSGLFGDSILFTHA